MSSRELIESLRRTGDEKVRLLHEDAEREADALKQEAVRKTESLRRQYEERIAAVAREEELRARAEAGIQARVKRLSAEQELAVRLREACRAALPGLRDDRYPAVFRALAKELPPFPWKVIRVNPADVDLARGYFPGADIEPAADITGGVDAAVADGSVRIINSFEKRLERAWDDLLPLLIRDAKREAGDGPSAKST